MANNTTYIIPINVQAIRVLEEDKGKFRGPTVQFSDLSTEITLGVQIDQDLSDSEDSASQIAEGVHLHWSLPDSLTHGVHDTASDTVIFPNAPNRWLVTRYFTPDEGTTVTDPAAQQAIQDHGVCVQQWIIESNRIIDPDSSTDKVLMGNMITAIPAVIPATGENTPNPSPGAPITLSQNLPQAPGLGYNLFGSREPYTQDWADGEMTMPEKYDPSLNALSYYGPSFSAYYQNGAAVFGFSDDFTDLGFGQGNLYGPTFKVSYHIIGWFSMTSSDIMPVILSKAEEAFNNQPKTNPIVSKTEFFNQYIQDELKWQASNPPVTGPGDPWPAQVQSLYNGLVLDIHWTKPALGPGNSQEFLPQPEQVESDLNLQFAIGNNSSEAIAALISSENFITPEGNNDDTEPYPVVERNVELLLNAFQQDLLRRLAGTDPSFQIPQLEEYLHTTRFSARNGGVIWSVRPKPTPPPANGNTTTANKSSGEIQLPLASAETLSLLNAAQQSYERQTLALQSRQVQAYLDWTQWGLLRSATDPNPKFDNGNTREYLESELLQIFSESGFPGVLSNVTQDNGDQSLQFQPVWTAVNTSAAGLIATMASAENQLELSFPAVGNSLLLYLQKALASLQAGNPVEALSSLQATITDSGIQNRRTTLQNLLAPTAPTNSISKLVGDAATQVLPNELSVLQAAAKNTTSTPGIADVIQAYATEGSFPAKRMLDTFATQQQPNLFNASNLVDTQQIWLFVEAAQYDPTNLTVLGAKLRSAQALLLETQNALQQSILPNFVAAQTTISSQFPILLNQLISTVEQINSIIAALGIIALKVNPDPADLNSIAQDLSNLIQTLNGYLVPGNASQITATAIRQAWQSLLPFLPSGHQVVILAQVMQDAVQQIDPNNTVQQGTAPHYWLPNDPVVVITQPSGSAETLLPVNRNGAATLLPYRLAGDLLTGLTLKVGGNTTTLTTDMLAGKTAVPQVYAVNLGNSRQQMVQQLLNEGYLLVPQTAYDVLVKAGGLDASLVASLQDIQNQLFAKISSDQEYQLTPPVETNLPPFSASQGNPPLDATFEGTLPYYIGLNPLQDTNPFLPLFLAWKADYDTIQLGDDANGHTGTVFPPDFLLKNFQLEADHVELNYDTPAPLLQCSDGQREKLSLGGQVTLSTRSASNLLNQIRVYFSNALGLDITKGTVSTAGWNDFQKDLYAVYEHFRTKTILSQGLNGFNSGLLQQLPLLQTPLNEIDSSDLKTTPLFVFQQQNWNYPQWNKVTVSPKTAGNLFIPLRAGRLRMQELYIVDTFGRYFQIGTAGSNPVQNNLTLAGSMTQELNNPLVPACQPADKNSNDIYLPPRIVQPARLSFDWLSAQSMEGQANTFVERTQQPAYTPIAGWMVPNHLDDSLVLYDTNGNALGSLGLEGSNRELSWRSVPSQTAIQNPTNNGWDQMKSDITDANPFLQEFLTQFAFPTPQGAGGNFQDFLYALDVSQRSIHTADLMQDKGLAVLIGRPFVLARAYMRLELQGMPNVALDSDSFLDAVTKFVGSTSRQQSDPTTWSDYDADARFKAGLTELAVPVDLGDLNQFDDGLVGFFLGNDWSTFYTPTSKSTSGGVQQSGWGTIQLLPNDSTSSPSFMPPPTGTGLAGKPQQDLVITMVMDPRAAVHATTGILPVKSITIPPVQYRDTLKKLMVYFLSNPVLLGKQSYDIPLPAEKGYEWSWVQPGKPEVPLESNTAGDTAQFGYSPQQILDGWLKLQPDSEQQS